MSCRAIVVERLGKLSNIAPLTSDDATCPNLSGTNEPLIDYNVVLKTDATNYDSVVKNHFEIGIFLEHEEFQGRQGKTIVEKTFCNNPADDNGHGTNVASLVGGKTLGVASNANIIGVKITGNDCPLTSQNIINGITYVMQQKANDPGRKIVLNLSATSTDSAVGDAASKAVEAGIHFVVGAGNRNLDA
ncbi:subtilisin-like protein, partial [Rhizophagus irregularis]